MTVLIKGNLSSRMYTFLIVISYNTETNQTPLIVIGNNYSRAMIFAV